MKQTWREQIVNTMARYYTFHATNVTSYSRFTKNRKETLCCTVFVNGQWLTNYVANVYDKFTPRSWADDISERNVVLLTSRTNTC